jgi:hypothetical protein
LNYEDGEYGFHGLNHHAGRLPTQGNWRSDEFLRIKASCHVYLETAATINGPWHTAADLTSAGVTETMLSSSSTTDLLSGYLRWRVAYTGVSGTAWTVCFKLTVYPSVGYRGTLQLNPRVA